MALTQSSIVLAVELDSGPVFIGTKYAKYGTDVVYAALVDEPSISFESVSLNFIADALPPECDGAWWAGREAALIEVQPGAGSVYDGSIVFDGQVVEQPAQSGNVLSVALGPRSLVIVDTPSAPPIDTITYPGASADDVGKVPPAIFGRVENCSLLAVDEPVATVLELSASPGQNSLTIADPTGFPAYGAVWVGGEAIVYNGVSGNQLVGLTVKQSHAKDAPVVLAGLARYLPAEHEVGIESVYADGKPVTGWQLDDDGLLRFQRRPLVEVVGQAMNVLAQFDQVATGAWDVEYDISYGAGRTLKADHITRTQVETSGTIASPGSAIKPGSITFTPTCTISNVSTSSTGSGLIYNCTVSVSGSVQTPSGAAVTITSAGGYDGVTVGGKPLTGKVSVSGGSINFGGSFQLSITDQNNTILTSSWSGYYDSINVSSTIARALSVGNTFDQARQIAWSEFPGGSKVVTPLRSDPISRIKSLNFPAVTFSWKAKTNGDPIGSSTPPSREQISRISESVPTLTDLNQIIIAPQSITSGNFTFTVEVAPQPRQDITNPASVYTASINGVSFSVPKEGGIVNVTAPVTAGGQVNVVHTLNHDVDMTGVVTTLFDGGLEKAIDYEVASAISLICPTIRKISVTWSSGSISNPALNPVNAIRGITGNVTQNAVSFDTSISTEGKGFIRFARPNTDRIVAGSYTVGYSVALNGYAGPMGVKIGSEWVYYAEGEVPTYAWNPATIQFDDDTDIIPVEVVGGIGTIVVTISTASRTVLTGNIDEDKYATLKHPNNINWKAVQVDEMPRMGALSRARLAVEWFMGGNKGAATPDVQVRFGGVLRGSLRLEAPAGATTSKTITVDVTSQGAATLTSSNISTVVSGGTASLSHQTQSFSNTITPPAVMRQISTSPAVWQSYSGGLNFIGWDSSMGSIKASLYIQAANSSVASGLIEELCEFLRANKTTISSGGTTYEEIVPGEIYARVVYLSEAPAFIRWRSIATSTLYRIANARFDWTGRVTQNAVSQSNTPASGYTSIPVPTLSHSGTAVAVNNGSFTITVPDSPRTVVTEFELPDVADWSDLTGKVCEINYTNGVSTLDIHLVKVQIAVDYIEENLNVVGGSVPLKATIIGRSENPADVVQYLGDVQGEQFSLPHLNRARQWFADNQYVFGRRISEPTDSLTLMTYAAEQSMLHMARTWDGRLAPVRWFDLSGEVIEIHERDLLDIPTIGWGSRVDNNITLNYMDGENGPEKSLIANATNNRYCRKGQIAMRRSPKVSIDAFWIRDDTTAQKFLDEYTRRYSRPRRSFSLSLPFTFLESVSDGSLIRFFPYNTAEDQGIFARVVRASSDSGWPVIEAEEILTN